MITAAMREAAYQALVKLGVPIPPDEIDAVLEAAEGARGACPDGFVSVPQQALDWLHGASPDHEGRWFEPPDRPAGSRPRPYWWRSRFREICDALSHQGKEKA